MCLRTLQRHPVSPHGHHIGELRDIPYTWAVVGIPREDQVCGTGCETPPIEGISWQTFLPVISVSRAHYGLKNKGCCVTFDLLLCAAIGSVSSRWPAVVVRWESPHGYFLRTSVLNPLWPRGGQTPREWSVGIAPWMRGGINEHARYGQLAWTWWARLMHDVWTVCALTCFFHSLMGLSNPR